VAADNSSAHNNADDLGYYGKPIVAPHVWKDAIGWYFFTGGLAGASSTVALVADLAGRPALAKHARRAAMIGLIPSPALLIEDLGRPERFANMLRILKLTSPMSVGSWLLGLYGPAAGGAWLLGEVDRLGRVRVAAGAAAGVLGTAVATYTAVLVANTATPVWHEAKGEMPFVFASSATASAGATATLLSCVGGGRADPDAARVAIFGAIAEVGAAMVMKRRLGELSTYDDPAAQPFDRAAMALSLGGAIGLIVARGRRVPSAIAAVAVACGSICERLAVLRAGTASATDPRHVLRQQA